MKNIVVLSLIWSLIVGNTAFTPQPVSAQDDPPAAATTAADANNDPLPVGDGDADLPEDDLALAGIKSRHPPSSRRSGHSGRSRPDLRLYCRRLYGLVAQGMHEEKVLGQSPPLYLGHGGIGLPLQGDEDPGRL